MRRAILAFAVMFLFVDGPAMAVEEPNHTTELREGAFEIRAYPTRVVAQVAVAGTQSSAVSSGFRILASYIFGGNDRRQTIAMTAPVTQFVPADAAGAQTWIVQFFMPDGIERNALPSANNRRIELVTLPPARVAVLRFSGWVTADGFARKSADLRAAIAAHQLRAIGQVTLAQYNPPWTLWFMRRNEVMAAVSAQNPS